MSRIRIAILGGGSAALSDGLRADGHAGTARSLHDDKIDLYQIGWRLGGKCASGRNRVVRRNRNEEHGLHVLGGFYYRLQPAAPAL